MWGLAMSVVRLLLCLSVTSCEPLHLWRCGRPSINGCLATDVRELLTVHLCRNTDPRLGYGFDSGWT